MAVALDHADRIVGLENVEVRVVKLFGPLIGVNFAPSWAASLVSALSDNIRIVVAVNTRSWSTSRIARLGCLRSQPRSRRNSRTERLLAGHGAKGYCST